MEQIYQVVQPAIALSMTTMLMIIGYFIRDGISKQRVEIKKLQDAQVQMHEILHGGWYSGHNYKGLITRVEQNEKELQKIRNDS